MTIKPRTSFTFMDLLPFLITFLLFRQVVEYEYYDNTTHRANEYEYEEEYDERYGPVEREPGYSLSTQVFHDFIDLLKKKGFFYRNY